MKVIYNKLIPFPGFFAINLFGIMFVREEFRNREIGKTTYNHESIHSEQMLDFVFGCEKLRILGGCIFYILYFIEWLIKLIIAGFTFGKIKAYYSISFEQEAYHNQRNYEYIPSRKKFS
jgi:hypothetical protein